MNKKKKLQFDDSGWAELSNGVQVHNAGQGSAILRGSGLFLSQNLESGDGSLVKDDPKLPYVIFKFRMLSKALIEDYALDFTKGNVLKDAIKLFTTKIFKDHSTHVENSIGVTMNPVWSNSRGLEGIDGDYKIFREFGASIISRLLTDPPILDSTSVGIRFTYEKSHPGLEDFYYHLGEEIDGEIVRLIITKILSVPEVSIVYAGADPNAKRLQANKYHNNDNSSSEIPGDENEQEDEMKLKASILKALGIALETFGLVEQGEEVEVSSEKFEAILTSVTKENSQLKENLAQYAVLFGMEKFSAGFEHNKNVAKLKELLEEPKQILEGYREDALKAYRLFMDNKEDQVMVDLIKNSDLKQAKAFLSQYGTKLNGKHPLRENSLGNKTRGSSGLSGEQSNNDDDEVMIVKVG
jgi:hypothetical protein